MGVRTKQGVGEEGTEKSLPALPGSAAVGVTAPVTVHSAQHKLSEDSSAIETKQGI